MAVRQIATALIAAIPLVASAALIAGAQDTTVVRHGDSVMVRFVEADLRSVVSMLAPYLDHPVMFAGIQPIRVSLEAPQPVPIHEILPMLRALVEGQNLEFAFDTVASVYRVRPRQIQRPAPNVVPPPHNPAATAGPTELFVVKLKHARAADVAAMVNALYGKTSALGEPGAPTPTLGQDLRQNLVPPAAPVPQEVPGAVGRAATLSGELTIVPDVSTNSLLVRASRSDFALVQAAVDEIDVRPLQVLIEVVIAEVRRDHAFSLGVDWKIPQTRIGKGNATASATSAGLGLGDFALDVMHIGGDDAEAVLEAAASHGDVRILSRPVLLAANNQSADITVGSQRPFIQVSRSLPTDVAQRDQVVEYKDVGTQLTVKPTISADGYVTLQLTQQVNQATPEVQFDAPIISTRSLQTQLLVKSGQTVVLGGIMDREHDVTTEGIPILSSIPIIGALFGKQTRETTSTELFLFLRPVVLFTDEDLKRETDPLRKRAGVGPTQ